jgi:hypothetical protein
MSGSVRSPLAIDLAGRPAPAQILGASTPGGAGAEAIKCLFGCDGEKKPATGEEKGSYRPEQYRAIRASIDQNPTYAVGTPAGDTYRASLRDLPLALQAKWVRGEWGAVEGCYFAHWDQSTMVVPWASIQAHWWDSHFLSIDYGFGRSSAAAHLHVCLQDGKIVTIGEIVLKHTAAYDFANELVRRFDLDGKANGQRRNVVVVYQDPANKSQTGTGHSVRDQINEVLDECDLGAIDGSNDRVGGWQLMYQMLARRQWLIADTCPLLVSAIPSRVHDPKKPGDLLKVGGDPLDDVCLAAGTMIRTNRGEVPIESVTDKDLVWTRDGLRRVLWCGKTGASLQVKTVETHAGRRLIATASHPVWVCDTGFTRVDELRHWDKVLVWQDRKPQYSTASHSADIQMPGSEPIASTSLQAEARNPNFAPMPVGPAIAATPSWIIVPRNVPSAEQLSPPTDIPGLSLAHDHVARITDGGIADVFNLKVDGRPEFFANDVLVHNCDSARYGLYSWVTAAEKPLEVRRAELVSRFAKDLNDETLPDAERRAVATSSLIRHTQMSEADFPAAGRQMGRFSRR